MIASQEMRVQGRNRAQNLKGLTEILTTSSAAPCEELHMQDFHGAPMFLHVEKSKETSYNAHAEVFEKPVCLKWWLL